MGREASFFSRVHFFSSGEAFHDGELSGRRGVGDFMGRNISRGKFSVGDSFFFPGVGESSPRGEFS